MRPLKAYWRSVARDAITFDVNKSATKVSFGLPCGRCIGCRLEKSRQWGLRCLHEKKMWRHNWYVTLTYADEFLPPGGSLSLRDVQLFMKKLRKAKGSSKENPVRFFLGGEYGEENRRPHYHALFFNCNFGDVVPYAKNARDEQLYTSKELSDIWQMGFCTLGEVTFDSAVYCAKYALKKLNVTEFSSAEDRAAYEKRYVVHDLDGEVFERCKEFAVMSRRPGIGAGYFEKYGSEVVAHDSVVVNGREVRPPRYYDERAMRLAGDVFERHKRRRKRMAVLNRADNTPERLRVKETLAQIAADRKERKL